MYILYIGTYILIIEVRVDELVPVHVSQSNFRQTFTGKVDWDIEGEKEGAEPTYNPLSFTDFSTLSATNFSTFPCKNFTRFSRRAATRERDAL